MFKIGQLCVYNRPKDGLNYIVEVMVDQHGPQVWCVFVTFPKTETRKFQMIFDASRLTLISHV